MAGLARSPAGLAGPMGSPADGAVPYSHGSSCVAFMPAM